MHTPEQMISYVNRRGFGFGSGLIDRAHSRFIVNIPKNASSLLLDWCLRSGQWNTHTVNLDSMSKVSTMIVVLRDPMERWISGIAQYLNGWILHAKGFYSSTTGPGPLFQHKSADQFIENYNWLTERLIFDNPDSFDDHVWPQHFFFETLLPGVERKYFFLDDEFTNKIKTYLDLPEPANDLDYNDSNNNLDMKKLKSFFRERIGSVPELKAAIERAYKVDYKLIREIK